MQCTSTSIPYQQIGSFSKIIVDYLNGSPELEPFYQHPVSIEGIRQGIESRKQFNTDRKLLVEVLRDQYKDIDIPSALHANIESLLEENTFSYVTAHQPNIFTGYLYFIYKILHVIRLAEFSAKQFPEYKFVPVYYMGSEDADLEELGKVFMNGEKIVWETDQKGAVGRMRPKGLEKIITRIDGELSAYPFGKELISLLRECYSASPDMQTATLKLVNALFAEYGLVILIPDNAALKRSMHLVFEDDLLNQTASNIVEQTINTLSRRYKVQANPREINLFYLKDDIRDRIAKNAGEWKVVGHEIRFSQSELKVELLDHPERFSPNVILRGLFQETILPNIAFIGGGGETAYWLELKDLFHYYKVPFPMLVLRNSFLFIEKKVHERIKKTRIDIPGLFREERLIIEDIVKRDTTVQVQLNDEISEMINLYSRLKEVAGRTDITLQKHVEALQAHAVNQLRELEKKMMRAEKRKFEDQQRQVHAIKEKLFPRNELQERVDNFMPYYAKFGKDFIRMLYENSPALQQEFVVLAED